MHVAVTNISKATVNPYCGKEIPNFEALGLSPDKIYQLYRDAEELTKGAATFNNVPLLNAHIPVSAMAPQKDAVVGSTGTNAKFVSPYLQNSLVIWDAEAIAGIESRDQCELSCSYRYRADMTPGVHEGVAYDGVMRDIVANHVALVESGRAGPDVLVADSNPFATKRVVPLVKLEYFDMSKASRKAVAVRAALGAFLRPKLAQDAAIGDLSALVRDVKAATLKKDVTRISKAVHKHFSTHLAADMALDEKEIEEVVKNAAEDEDDDDDMADDEDEQREGESDEDYEKRMKAKEKPKAEDEDDPKNKPEVSKKAMDAAIKKAADDARADAIASMQAVRIAEKEVAPLIGEVAAMDSAEAIYKMALDQAKVDLEGVHPSAYRSMVKLLVAHPAKPEPRVAMDSAAAGEFEKMFPTASKLARSY
ncbi:MAG: DUF2213 domain-containing protein [Pseudomonadota bacterium]|nr:DUF2213 domain-containing protein [Pseudomonadota bacterium]